MITIVMANQKGGVGKTTLTGHLAVQAQAVGDGPTAVIDMDPQGNLAEWVNARQAETPIFLDPSQLGGLAAALKKAAESGVGVVLIDTPPSKSPLLEEVLKHADLVVLPIQASPHDLRAVGPTIQLVQQANRRMIFVLNRVKERAKLTNQAIMALSQHGTIAPIMVVDRTDFASSMVDQTIMEVAPGSKGALEIEKLWAYVKEKASLNG
jgi:chromosome partitioning protein